jgi:hypothetical protein
VLLFDPFDYFLRRNERVGMLLHLRKHLVDLRDLPRMLGCRVGVPTIADEDDLVQERSSQRPELESNLLTGSQRVLIFPRPREDTFHRGCFIRPCLYAFATIRRLASPSL